MSTPDNRHPIYDLGTVISSSPGLDIIEVNRPAPRSEADVNFKKDSYGLAVEPSIAEMEMGSLPARQEIWVHTYNWGPRPAPVVVVDFSPKEVDPQNVVREELQVA